MCVLIVEFVFDYYMNRVSNERLLCILYFRSFVYYYCSVFLLHCSQILSISGHSYKVNEITPYTVKHFHYTIQ